MASALRHLKQRKPHLAERDADVMDATASPGDTDLRAFMHAVRWCARALKKEPTLLEQEAIGRLLNSDAAALPLVGAVTKAAGLPAAEVGMARIQGGPLPPASDLAALLGRLCRFGEALDLTVDIPEKWATPVTRLLRTDASAMDTPSLLALAEAAHGQGQPGLAKAAAGAGLSEEGPLLGRFLLLQGMCLPATELARSRACFRAAVELGRTTRDTDLVERALAMGRLHLTFGFLGSPHEEKRMEPDEMRGILETERAAVRRSESRHEEGRKRPKSR